MQSDNMYAIIYLNWSGSKEEFDEAWKSLKKIAEKFDDLDLVDIYVPSSEWNYAALIKFKAASDEGRSELL